MLLSAESTYPLITLPEPVVVVPQVTTDTILVVRVIEDMTERRVSVDFLVGDNPYPKTCVVIEGDGYFPDWDDTTVADAIIAFLNALT